MFTVIYIYNATDHEESVVYPTYQDLEHGLLKRKREWQDELLLVTVYNANNGLSAQELQRLRVIQEPELFRVK